MPMLGSEVGSGSHGSWPVAGAREALCPQGTMPWFFTFPRDTGIIPTMTWNYSPLSL